VRARLLAIFFGVVFALTLFLAVAAGAQEESTSTEGVGVQAVEVQQQQVPDNQQQVVEVQQQQVGPAAAPAPYGGPLAHKPVRVTKGKGNGIVNKNDVLKITGDYEVKEGASITIEDADGTQATFTDDVNAKITDEDNGDIRIEVTKEPVTVPSDGSSADPEGDTLNINNLRAVTSTDVQRAGTNDGGGDGGGGDGGGGSGGDGSGGGGGGGNNQVNAAQETTAPDTTTSDLNTANPDTTAADANALNTDFNRPDSGSFRCDLFLRTVRDDRGALLDQYRRDEEIVQRFEQCLSENVLADTIPNRNLPFTGGMSLVFLAAIGLAAIVASIAVLRAVMRRAR
jgi:hypothetical protein